MSMGSPLDTAASYGDAELPSALDETHRGSSWPPSPVAHAVDASTRSSAHGTAATDQSI